MKVKELIALLQQMEPELEVLMTSDSEGNSINKVDEIEVSHYDNSSMGHREIELVHPDDIDEDNREFLNKAVVIWPY